MRKRLPPLNALRAFEAAARNKSFKGAAEELFVSHSAISHQVRRLEQYLSIDLFRRVSRGVELTRAGRIYYPVLREAFDMIDEGTDLVLSPEAPGTLTVQVYSTFAIRWLIPRLPAFREAHPDVHVRLHTSQSDVNFEHEDVDICVMLGQRVQPDVHYDYLFSSQTFPVCSPALARGRSPLREPADLAHHTIIQVYPSRHDWAHWLEQNGVEGIEPDGGLLFDSYDLALNTAIQGLGVALGLEPFVNRDLEAGTLVEAFPGARVNHRGTWYLACRKEKTDNEKVCAFRDWLLAEVKRDSSMHRHAMMS
ncbi:MAG: transcriptional regulator GcvA [Xanthomonadales bacterium]|nr:transcriptional regulator GcvA [Xanthomonadales bacterium]